MALDANATKLTNLVNPQVMADLIDKKLVDLMRFAPLATIDRTLQGRPGNTISLPSFTYIGDAVTVGEGVDIGIKQLTASAVTATIHKIGNGVQITDEAVLSGYGDPVGEATRQLALSIASQVDNEFINVLNAITSPMASTVGTAGTLAFGDIADALELFGEDVEDGSPRVILISPKQYTLLRKTTGWLPASDISADLAIKGVVGMVQGCQVLVSNKLKEASSHEYAYIVKPGALRLFMKRGVLVESDRDIINKSTVITADSHFAPYLYDASKAIKITVK